MEQLQSYYLYNAKKISQDMKKPLSIEEMITNLKDKLSFDESEIEHVRMFFKKNNYYRFSIFPKLMPPLTNGKEKYSFTDVKNIYELDSFLRNKIYIFTTALENSWKSSIVEYLCNNYESKDFATSQCYLDLNLYNSEVWGRKIVQSFARTINESNSLAIKHHKSNKKSCVPIWVLIEEITFGQLNTFISQLKPKYIKEWATDLYDPQYASAIISWLELIRVLRNKISHHARLYGAKITSHPKVLKIDQKHFFHDTQAQVSYFYSFLYVLYKLIKYEDSAIQLEWNQFISEFFGKICEHNLLVQPYEKLGLTDSWEQLLKI